MLLPPSLRGSTGNLRCKATGWVLAISGVGVFCCPAALAAQSVADRVITATSQIRDGQYAAAIATVQHALASRPQDARLLTVEGIAYSLKGDDTHALNCLHDALKASPGFQRALQAEASILSRRRDPAVIPVLEQILHEVPHDSTAHEMLALAEAQNGDCAAALREFHDAGPALATHAASLQHKAACLLETKAYPEAVTAFQQLHGLRPDDSGTVYDLAIAQTEAGDAKAAVETLAPVLKQTPDVDTLLLAADLYEQEGDTPRSAALLRQAIVADPTRSNSYVRFAELCMTHESYQPGIDMVTAGMSRQPHDPSLFLARGLLYGGMAEYDKAEADFRSAEQYDPRHGKGAYAVGLIEAQRNNPESAITTVRAALATHPDDAQLNFLLARLLLETGTPLGSPLYAEATRAAQKAVGLDPGLVAARDLLAKIYMDTGKPLLAVEQCRAALVLDPDDGNALYRLMRSLRATGDNDGAHAVAQQVAAQRQHAREEQNGHLRYRIENGAAPQTGPAASLGESTPAKPAGTKAQQ